MNILLVDDDVYVTETLQKSIDWISLGVENVYAAHSVDGAKKILEEIPIHILICDIEMPKENGFALLEWINEREYVIKQILLTSYAEFEYASKAIKLNCFAYVLKPVNFDEMEETLRKAIEAQKETLKTVNMKKYYEEYLLHSEKLRKEHFWSEVLFSVPEDVSATEKQIRKNELSYSKQNFFVPVFIEYFSSQNSNEYLRGMFEWNLKNLIFDIFSSSKISTEAILAIKRERLLAIIKLDALARDDVFGAAKDFVQRAENKFGLECCVVLGMALDLQASIERTRIFLKLCEEKILCEIPVQAIDDYEYKSPSYSPPDFLLWENFILDGNENAVLNASLGYIDALMSSKRLDREVLKKFMFDFLQMLISVLAKKNIILHNMESPFFSVDEMEVFTHSSECAKRWVKKMVGVVFEMIFQKKGSQSIVKKIKEYIDCNLDKDITRESLAKSVFLNPDYLSRIFKKEIGESIGNYIISKRMETAKEYLEKTNEPVNAVAVKVGYDNFSYFSKVFKNYVGTTPKEYKANIKKMQ